METWSDEDTDLPSSAMADIVAQILLAARHDDDVERDRSSSENPSISQSNELISLMIRNDLLKYDKRSGSYKVTRKGEAFLKTYHQTQDFMKLIDEEIGL